MTKIKLIILIVCAALLLAAFLLFRGCTDEESVDTTPAPDPAQELHALQAQISLLKAEKSALQEAVDTNHATLVSLQAQWHEAEADYAASKDRCEEAMQDRNKYFTELTTRTDNDLKYQQDIFNLQAVIDEWSERYAGLLSNLEKVKARENTTVSTNFTVEMQDIFYLVYDRIYWELIRE